MEIKVMDDKESEAKYDKDLAYAFVFANKDVYFLKVWNCYYCYQNLGGIVNTIREKGLSTIVTEKMPDGINENEGGMRLLSNGEIRRLRDSLEAKT